MAGSTPRSNRMEESDTKPQVRRVILIRAGLNAADSKMILLVLSVTPVGSEPIMPAKAITCLSSAITKSSS